MSGGCPRSTLSPMFSTIDIQQRLSKLETERMLASLVGLGADPAYMDDLRDEIDATRAAFVGAAVTEIATLRGQLDGPLYG